MSSLIGSSARDWRRQKQPDFMQHFLKRPPGIAWARIVSTEFFQQIFITVYNPESLLHLRLGWEAVPAFTGDLESRLVRGYWFS